MILNNNNNKKILYENACKKYDHIELLSHLNYESSFTENNNQIIFWFQVILESGDPTTKIEIISK